MKNLVVYIQKICSENDFNPKILIEFLESFFGNSVLGLRTITDDKEKINVLILEKGTFFNFEYTKIDNKVNTASIAEIEIDKIEETFNGTCYRCIFHSKCVVIYDFHTRLTDSMRNMRNFINSINSKRMENKRFTTDSLQSKQPTGISEDTKFMMGLTKTGMESYVRNFEDASKQKPILLLQIITISGAIIASLRLIQQSINLVALIGLLLLTSVICIGLILIHNENRHRLEATSKAAAKQADYYTCAMLAVDDQTEQCIKEQSNEFCLKILQEIGFLGDNRRPIAGGMSDKLKERLENSPDRSVIILIFLFIMSILILILSSYLYQQPSNHVPNIPLLQFLK